jgi:hypothetical protein
MRTLVCSLILAGVFLGCSNSADPNTVSGSNTGDGAEPNEGDADPNVRDGGVCPGGCAANQLCSAGACVEIPDHCPCPSGAYCDLLTNSCKPGCFASSDCSPDQDCSDAHNCVPHVRVWTSEHVPTTDPNSAILSVWGSSETDVYITDGSSVYHSHGDGIWSAQGLPGEVWSLWGSSASDVYGAGAGGAVVHSIGDGVWRLEDSSLRPMMGGLSTFVEDLSGIWGTGPNDIYAVGSDTGLYVHSGGGGSWTTLGAADHPLRGAWGVRPTVVLLLGVY